MNSWFTWRTIAWARSSNGNENRFPISFHCKIQTAFSSYQRQHYLFKEGRIAIINAHSRISCSVIFTFALFETQPIQQRPVSSKRNTKSIIRREVNITPTTTPLLSRLCNGSSACPPTQLKNSLLLCPLTQRSIWLLSSLLLIFSIFSQAHQYHLNFPSPTRQISIEAKTG